MKKQQGFTLLEIFVSLSVGLVLLGGVLSVFVGMKGTSKITTSYGNMQETGRFAISILTEDLMRQGFWGDMTMALSRSSLQSVPGDPVGECKGEGINNGSFPLAAGHFRTIWGVTATSATVINNCITDAKISSDVLQLKRVVTTNEVGALDVNNYYLVTNLTEGSIIDGGDTPPVINNSRTWEYQHHLYYVSESTIGSNKIPTLNMITLANTMSNQPLIDGVEMIRFMYGVDSNSDGVVNAFISAGNMTQGFWDNENSLLTGDTSKIIAVKMFVLVRDIQPDNKYTNSISYQLGDFTFTAQGDNYHRTLFSSMVTLYNGDVDVW